MIIIVHKRDSGRRRKKAKNANVAIMDRPRPAHYSFSAPQLSYGVKATTSTVYLASSPSSSCSFNLSDVDDSTFYDSTYASQPFPSTSRVPSETSTDRRSSRASTVRSSHKADDEVHLTYFDVSGASRRRWRDVVPGSRVAKLICTSILAVVCCVLASRLVVDKLSAYRDVADAIGTIDLTNETEVVLALGEPLREYWPSSSVRLQVYNATRRNDAGKTKAGLLGTSAASELRYRARAMRRYHPATRMATVMTEKTSTLPSAHGDSRFDVRRTTKLPEKHLKNTAVTTFAQMGEASARPKGTTSPAHFYVYWRQQNLSQASPKTAAWLNVERVVKSSEQASVEDDARSGTDDVLCSIGRVGVVPSSTCVLGAPSMEHPVFKLGALASPAAPADNFTSIAVTKAQVHVRQTTMNTIVEHEAVLHSVGHGEKAVRGQ
ncbi:hypothetical protein HPB50_019220 [Hyalomma asiaticum]|uniref:Uncharacterized protein n=1 Tax=Hyalomma asiaticum TaxID=266040 RepID=A0ACB7SXC5_HYAAI|nr:hypothetical protein HPB50_019220 [Hyalomma asiaticum]